ncbi:hypothetical protein TK90_2645 (plasmid) [Thioalkalivibrio sp. K90mix]|uniref:hypothetical protein n=1 Tax=Thioalkalivibrio sp. (strain K90mix) TaxID=396595 RepID=UPI000195ABA1|nr:hypothetical protein [Thioalkalivibrio sp. K90mix]ADC73132.1 hypothetical protein TK90_2645 [Thioalkalivibrio sp. K90mix]
MSYSDTISIGSIALLIGGVLVVVTVLLWWRRELERDQWKAHFLLPALLLLAGTWILHGHETSSGQTVYDWPFQRNAVDRESLGDFGVPSGTTPQERIEH